MSARGQLFRWPCSASAWVFFLDFGQYKSSARIYSSGGFQFWINNSSTEALILSWCPSSAARPPARHDHRLPCAYGELAIGLRLVLGILVRSASFCGLSSCHHALLFGLPVRERRSGNTSAQA